MNIILKNYEFVIKNIIESSIKDFNIIKTFDFDSVSNYLNILDSMDKYMNSLLKESLIKFFIRIDEDFKNSAERKRKYHIKSYQTRTLLTIFGEITIKRIFYTSILNNSSFCFLDSFLGLAKYDYFDPYIKSLVINYSTNFSMSKSADIINDLIGKRINTSNKFSYLKRQNVYYIIKNMKLANQNKIGKFDNDTIYIMMDETFKAIQKDNDKQVMIKGLVLFNDIENVSKGRNKLIDKRFFTSFENDKFLDNTLDYIYQNYDTDKLKTIYVMGDGASWIKSKTNHFKFNSDTDIYFCLDKFHFKQALHHLFLNKDLEELMVTYLLNNNTRKFKEICDLWILNYPYRRETIVKKRDYILKHLKHIKILYEKKLSCPMESQISHLLASKIKQRPKAYSKHNLNQILELISLDTNGYNTQELYLEQYNKKDIVNPSKQYLNLDILNKDKQIPQEYNQYLYTPSNCRYI